MQLRGRRVFRRRTNEPNKPLDPATALLALALLAGFVILVLLFAR